MNLYCRLLILTLLTFLPILTFAQQNTLTIGLNTSYFKDWNRLRFNFFNPEVSYSRFLSNKYRVSYTLNVFYGGNLSKENMKEEAIINRLIFSNDFTLDYSLKDFYISAGPSIRYRNEKKILYFYPQGNPFEFVIDRNKSHVDIGAAFKSGYNIHITKKSIVVFKLSYRLYNKGVNPISFGLSYGWTWD